MAIKLTSTKDSALNGIKMTVYGASGVGKTALAATTGEPTVIISAEGGLLSLRGHDIPVIEVKTIDDVGEAYQFISTSKEGQQFQWVVLDSISEVAEVVLASEKKILKDARQAYMTLQDKMYEMIRAFRDLPGKNVYFSAKLATDKIDIVETRTTGAITTNVVVGTRMQYGPSMPGTKLGQGFTYFTDLTFAMRVEKDQNGNQSRWLQTQPDENYTAKDRSGVLDPFELPNIAAIAAKIRNSTTQSPN